MEQLPTLIGISWAVKQIKIPIIAVGGISDTRTSLASLAMGAEAAYMGTAFMATLECPVPDKHKEYLLRTRPDDPALMKKVLYPPEQKEMEKVMKEKGRIPHDEWLSKLERVLLKEDPDKKQSYDTGEVIKLAPGSLAVSGIDSIPSVAEFIEGIIHETEDILTRGVFAGMWPAKPALEHFLELGEGLPQVFRG